MHTTCMLDRVKITNKFQIEEELIRIIIVAFDYPAQTAVSFASGNLGWKKLLAFTRTQRDAYKLKLAEKK